MAGEFIKPAKQKPAVLGTIADPDEYNQNIAGQNKDSFLCIDADGNYKDGDLGNEAIVSAGNGGKTGVLFNNIKLRDGSGLIKVYNDSGVLVRTITFDQATETQLGTAEIATQAETDAGTDDLRIVTPLKLKNTPLNSGRLVSIQTFNSSGTWTKPAGISKIFVEVVAGGGGASRLSGYGGRGGGAGGIALKLISNVVSPQTVTIGAGGAGGAGASVSGSQGGTSSFGSICSATGGQGGEVGSAEGGIGGVGSSGDFNLKGNDGDGDSEGATFKKGGSGGVGYYGGGAGGSNSTARSGSPNSGSGGAGGGSGVTGGAGGSGVVVIWEYS